MDSSLCWNDGLACMTGVLDCYESLLAAGELKPDVDQRRAVTILDRLAGELESPPRRGLWARLSGAPEQRPRGVYLWGGVGRGKSMLMDIAFNMIAVDEKRRV